jgi:multidrug efflux system membrane fusion protein
VNIPLAQDTGKPGTEKEERNVRRRSWKWLWIAILLVLMGGSAFLFWHHREEELAAAAAKQKAQAQAAGLDVVATAAHKGQIGVYVNGLGSVTPVYTVTVSSVISGQLLEVRYQEGQVVQKGDLLVQVDPRPYEATLTQYEGNLLRDQAYLDNARIDLARYQTLWARNAIPQQQLATQEALVKQYEGVVKSDQGQIDTAKLDIEYCHVTAPITGRVGLRLVDPGNIVSANSTALVVITQMTPITVVFTIGEDQLPPVLKRLRAGQHLEVDAYDRAQTTKLAQGTLQTIDNQIDPTTGTVKLRASFDNKNEELFPDQFVNIRLLVEEKRNVTLVPNAGIQRSSQATYSWVVNADKTVGMRTITVGTAGANESEVTKGLSPGEIVVTDGVDRLQPGTKVNVQVNPPPATPNAPAGANPQNPTNGTAPRTAPQNAPAKKASSQK